MLGRLGLGFALALLANLLASCTSIADVVRALAADPATVCITYMGPQGNLALSRTNAPGTQLLCRGEGHQLAPVAPMRPLPSPTPPGVRPSGEADTPGAAPPGVPRRSYPRTARAGALAGAGGAWAVPA